MYGAVASLLLLPPVVAAFTGTVLLCGFDGSDGATSAPDESTRAHALTFVGNAQLDTAQSKFGGSSLLLDGSGDAVLVANSPDFLFGDGPFTVAGFARFNSVAPGAYLVGVYDVFGERSWAINKAAGGSGKWQFQASTGGFTGDSTPIDAVATTVTGQWYHFQVERDAAGVLRLYRDGVMLGKATFPDALHSSIGKLSIGCNTSDGNANAGYHNGWLEEILIIKGEALCGSDAGFTVPTSAYPRPGGAVAEAVGLSTAAAVGASTFAAVGSAAGVGTASSVGASVAASVGSAAGTSSVGGVSQQPGDAVGSAQGTSTVSAVGESTVAATASAAGIGAASGSGASTAAAVGSASGASTVSGVAGGGWTPADLGTALKAWYKGDEVTGSNGDQIGTWTDASGNANNATQATASKKPTLVTADLNSKNVLRWTAANSQLFSLPNIFSGASAASAYLVIKTVADPSASTATSGLWTFGSQSGASATCHYPFTDSNVYDGFASTARKSAGNPTPSLASWRILGVHSAASDWAMMIDGAAFFSTGTNTVGFTSFPVLGESWSSTPTAWLNGWIAEAIFTNAKQSQSDREKVEGYLAHKWGLTGNLSAGHPYKTSPP